MTVPLSRRGFIAAQLARPAAAPARPPWGGVRAAVLVPLIERAGGMTVLLTRRADSLADHAGQISFPGGRIDAADADAAVAALREAHEEIGLDPAHVEVCGELGACITGTGFVVTPIVGFVAPDFRPVLAVAEVAEVFEAPLEFILKPTNRHLETALLRGRQRTFHVFAYGGRRIWGATAAMLVDLADRLSAQPAP